MLKNCLAALAAALFLAFTPAFGLDAHEHGAAKLNLAIEGNTVEIGFETPLINLISFERAPKNEQEREEVRKMADLLRHPQTLFLFPKGADCRLKTLNLESEVLADELLGVSDPAEKHGEDADDHKTEHADLDAEFIFTCQNPAALNQIEVGLFKAFPALKRIEAQLVTPRGQKAAKLTPRANRLIW